MTATPEEPANPELLGRVADRFAEEFGSAPEGVWFAPGRINLVGAHLDYNGGDVLPMADAAVAAQPWTSWIALAWAGGVLILAARAARHALALRRIVRGAQPLGAPWDARMAAWCRRAGLRRPVLWLETAEVDSPMMFGWLKPVVLFPLGLALRLPVDQAELLMLHELAHIRRMDGLGNVLQVIAETLLFFHPALRWMSRRIRHDRELACDEAVSAEPARRLSYARALLAVAEFRRDHQIWAMAASGGVLRERVEHLFEPGVVRLEPRRSFAWLLALACASLILVQWMLQQNRFSAPLPLQAVARTAYSLTGVMPPSLTVQRFGIALPVAPASLDAAIDLSASASSDSIAPPLPAPLTVPAAWKLDIGADVDGGGSKSLPAAPADLRPQMSPVALSPGVALAADAEAPSTAASFVAEEADVASDDPGAEARACRPVTGSRLCRERGDWQAESNKVTVIVPAR